MDCDYSEFGQDAVCALNLAHRLITNSLEGKPNDINLLENYFVYLHSMIDQCHGLKGMLMQAALNKMADDGFEDYFGREEEE